jgi:hypothetical protein
MNPTLNWNAAVSLNVELRSAEHLKRVECVWTPLSEMYIKIMYKQ